MLIRAIAYIKNVFAENQRLKILFCLFLSFLFSSCTEKKFRDAHDDNIKFSSHFSEAREDMPDMGKDLPDLMFECKKASFNIDRVNINSLAELLGKVYEQNINSTEGPDSRDPLISLRVKDICLEALLDELTNLYDIGNEKTFSAYTIYPPEVRSKIFTVDYHNFYRNGSSSISISSSQLESTGSSSGSGGGQNFSKIDTKSVESFWDNLEKTLSIIVLDGVDPQLIKSAGTDPSAIMKGHVSVYRDSGVVVVRSYPRTLKHVESFLNSITHKATKQVLIEAKILEVTLSDEYQTGIYWGLLKQHFKFSSFVNPLETNPKDIFLEKTLTASDTSGISSVISSKFGNKTDFDSVIQALSIQGKVSVLSSPKIAALNNQRALIKFGEDSYFITNVTSTTLSGSNNNSTQSGFSMTPYFSGIALDTTPSIMNNNEIILHIHPIISTVKPEVKTATISGQESKIPSAKIQTRETDTVVKSQSGDIIVIGGLMQSTVDQSESGLPIEASSLLSKVFSPFKAKKKTSKKVELVILLKPTISPGWTQSDEEFQKYLSSKNPL